MDVGSIALPARCSLPNSRIDPLGVLNGYVDFEFSGVLFNFHYNYVCCTLSLSLSGGVDHCHYFLCDFMEKNNFFFDDLLRRAEDAIFV